MPEIAVNKQEIKKFVREELGCTCEDEVFESISIAHRSRGESKAVTGYLLKLGGRLLVYLIESEIRELLAGELEQVFKWGRELRDAGGYNRFRLVVVTADVDLVKGNLYQQFSTFADLDERLHLHVIRPDKIPLTSLLK